MFLALASCVGIALHLLDLIRLPFRHFLNKIQNRLLPGDANLYKLHHGMNLRLVTVGDYPSIVATIYNFGPLKAKLGSARS